MLSGLANSESFDALRTRSPNAVPATSAPTPAIIGNTSTVGNKNPGRVPERIVNGPKEANLARRRYQRGTLLLLGSKTEKRWYGRWYEDILVSGQVRRIRRQEFLGTVAEYPTKKLATRELDARLETINSPTYSARPTATFAEFAKRWEADVVSLLRPSTASNYRMHIRRHLTPFFGKEQVKDIGPEMVQRFVARQKSAPKTVRNLCVTLQSMWRSARANRYVAHDIFEGVVLPKARRTQRFFFSPEDVQRIISATKEPYRTWYGLAAETGLRAGELCGLTVDDINLERGILQVRQSAWRGKLGDPKTNDSIRVVELSPQACAHLEMFLKSWHPNPSRLLFATRNGTPWDQNLLLKRQFRPLLRALGILVPRGNGFHAFRHANATLMNSFGASHRLRQQRLGHAAGSPVTEAIYTHVISEDGKRIAAQLGDAVWGISDVNGREKQNGLEVAASKPFQIN
jgi:integrase